MTKYALSAILLAPVIPGAGDLMAGEPFVSDRALQSTGLVRYWEARLPLGSQETVENGHLVDGSLYITTNRGVLYALDAEVGLIRWAEKVSKPGFSIGEPTHVADAPGLDPVLVPTSARLYALNRFTGKTLQTFDAVLPPGARVVGFQNALFVGSSGPQLYGFLWLNCPVGGLSPLWEVDVGTPVSAGPILFDGDSLLFGTQGGHAVACLARDKRLLWSTCTGGSFVGDPVADDIGVYLANNNRSLYKFQIDTGRQIWRKRFRNPLEIGPIVVAHLVFQFCPEVGLSAIDADTGRETWRDGQGRTLAAHLSDRDVVFGMDRRLRIHDHETGAVLGSVAAPGASAAVTNADSDATYLLGPGGAVLCLRPSGTPYLKSHEMAAARNSLNRPPDTGRQGQAEPGTGETQEQADTSDNPFQSQRDVGP